MGSIVLATLITLIAFVGYAAGVEQGRLEYFKGQIECKQAFEVIECRKVKDE